MSAPLRPAALTRTSSSPACGTGSGCSSTTIEPSRMVAARMAADPCTGRRPPPGAARCTRIWSQNTRLSAGAVVKISSEQLGNTASMGRPRCRACHSSLTSRRSGASRASDSSWRTLRRSPVYRGHGVPDGGGRAVLLIPGFLAGDGSLGDDDPLAAPERLPHAPGRDPRQRRLLRGGLRAAGGAPGGLRRAHGPEGLDRRPEPRRRVRPRAGRQAPGPRGGHRHARLARGLPAAHPPARARPGRGRLGARHAPSCPACSPGAACAATAASPSATRSPARSPPGSATSRCTRAATASSTGTRAWTRPPSSSRSAPRTAACRSTRRSTARSASRSADLRRRRRPTAGPQAA